MIFEHAGVVRCKGLACGSLWHHVQGAFYGGEVVDRVSGGIGSTGLLTERGLAYLVWRDGAPMLAGKGIDMPATPGQVETVRGFSSDVKSALG